jgi:hypothetical protein
MTDCGANPTKSRYSFKDDVSTTTPHAGPTPPARPCAERRSSTFVQASRFADLQPRSV